MIRWLSKELIAVIASIAVCLSFEVGHALTPLSEKEMTDITAKKGLNINLDNFNANIDFVKYTDEDGNNTSNQGVLQFGGVGTNNDLLIGDGSGGAVSLSGASIDVDGGQNQIIFGAPSNLFTIRSETVFLGDTNNNTFKTRIDDINVGNTEIAVGAN